MRQKYVNFEGKTIINEVHNPYKNKGSLVRGDITPRRGAIKEFSDKSARRLKRRLEIIDWDYYYYKSFLTLTIPSSMGDIPKNMLRNVKDKLKYYKISGVWKKEFHKDGRIHFHLLIWSTVRDQDYKKIESRIVASWCRDVELMGYEKIEHVYKHGVRFDEINGVEKIQAYLSKYVAKPTKKDNDFAEDDLKRFWGFFGSKPVLLSVVVIEDDPKELDSKLFYASNCLIFDYVLSDNEKKPKSEQELQAFTMALGGRSFHRYRNNDFFKRAFDIASRDDFQDWFEKTDYFHAVSYYYSKDRIGQFGALFALIC